MLRLKLHIVLVLVCLVSCEKQRPNQSGARYALAPILWTLHTSGFETPHVAVVFAMWPDGYFMLDTNLTGADSSAVLIYGQVKDSDAGDLLEQFRNTLKVGNEIEGRQNYYSPGESFYELTVPGPRPIVLRWASTIVQDESLFKQERRLIDLVESMNLQALAGNELSEARRVVLERLEESTNGIRFWLEDR